MTMPTDNPHVKDRISEAIEELCLGLRADGADLQLDYVSEDTTAVSVSLVVGPDTCMDCILPKDHLISVIEANIRRHAPAVRDVMLHDPRN